MKYYEIKVSIPRNIKFRKDKIIARIKMSEEYRSKGKWEYYEVVGYTLDQRHNKYTEITLRHPQK